MTRVVEIVEVGPRDGLQGIGPFVPTADKIDLVRRLAAARLRRIEVGSFVSPRAVPQLADTGAVLEAALSLPDVAPQVLVPTVRQAEAALAHGAPMLAFVLSVSTAHNFANVRRDVSQSGAEYGHILGLLDPVIDVRLNLATAFDCPFDGKVSADAVVRVLDDLLGLRPDAEICLCDTTGRAEPSQVARLFADLDRRYPGTRWAYHAHDTYGLGAATTYAAFTAGVRVFDAAVAGLGGCPFAPGATGNVATEDLVWMFERMGVTTGVDLDSLLSVARDAATLPGAASGGRVRAALGSVECGGGGE